MRERQHFCGPEKGTENAWNMIAVTDNDTGDYFGIGLLTSSPAEPHALIILITARFF